MALANPRTGRRAARHGLRAVAEHPDGRCLRMAGGERHCERRWAEIDGDRRRGGAVPVRSIDIDRYRRRQFGAPRARTLRTVLDPKRKRVIDGRQQLRAIAAFGVLRAGLIAVFSVLCERLRALDSVVRRASGHGAIDRRAEAVDIAPWPLLIAPARVLLNGRVARRDEIGDGARFADHGVARRAEIQQHRRAVVTHEDVGRLDVAMHEALRVDLFEAVEQRMQDLQDLVFEQRATTLEQAVEALALLILHHHIGGVIRFKNIVHAHDAGMFELGQGARFDNEAFEPRFIFVGEFVGECQYRAILLAMRKLARQVFLDRDRTVQIVVGGEVGDAESALTKHPVDGVPMQFGAGQKGVAMGKRRCGHALGTSCGGSRFDIPLNVGQGKQAKRRRAEDVRRLAAHALPRCNCATD